MTVNHREDFHHAMALALRYRVMLVMNIMNNHERIPAGTGFHVDRLLNQLPDQTFYNAHDRLMIMEIYQRNYKV